MAEEVRLDEHIEQFRAPGSGNICQGPKKFPVNTPFEKRFIVVLYSALLS